MLFCHKFCWFGRGIRKYVVTRLKVGFISHQVENIVPDPDRHDEFSWLDCRRNRGDFMHGAGQSWSCSQPGLWIPRNIEDLPYTSCALAQDIDVALLAGSSDLQCRLLGIIRTLYLWDFMFKMANLLNKDPFTYEEERKGFLQDLRQFHRERR